MIWAPQKELTLDEVLLQAREELYPFWIGVDPQFVGVSQSGGAVLLPLNQDFFKKTWLFVFVDPTQYAGRALFWFVKRWFRRYHVHGIEVLLILMPAYSHWKEKEWVYHYCKSTYFSDFEPFGLSGFPVVIDADQMIQRAFNVQRLPEVILFRQDRCCVPCSRVGENFSKWFINVELELQNFLRVTDPGLSLAPLMGLEEVLQKQACQDQESIEFGFLKSPVEFSAPGFQTSVNTHGEKLQSFTDFFLHPALQDSKKCFLYGVWSQNGESISTRDPQAILMIQNQGSVASVIAQSLSEHFEPALIVVMVDQQSVHSHCFGEDLLVDENSQSVLRVRQAQSYHFLDHGLQRQWITFTFPKALTVPIRLFGMRLGCP